SITYGNGVLTRYDYDPRLRLTEIDTEQPQHGSELVHFGYIFDDASNILRIDDRRSTQAVPASDPRRNTQLFNYDDLYRVKYAGYAFGAPGVTNVDGGS